MASKRYVVAQAEDLPAGARKIVSVNNREIGVFNIGDRYYALRNSCPHKNGPLCRGRLRPLVVSPGVYQIDYQQEGLVLKCPWHQWEFDLATGQALYDETMRVKTYAAGREGEEVVVYVE